MIGALLRAARRRARSELDLVLLGVLFTALQPVVPPGHFLARDDLMPWSMAVLGAAAFLRGRSLGAGPHRMLPTRSSASTRLVRRLAGAIVPLALLAAYDLALMPSEVGISRSLLTSGALILASWISRDEGRSAWNPESRNEGLLWIAGGVVAAAAASGLGHAVRIADGSPWAWLAEAALIALAFLCVGLAHGHPRNERQRGAARIRQTAGGGRRSGGTGGWFRFGLAIAGPTLGYLLLQLMTSAQVGDLAYGQAFVLTAFVLAWAGVLWGERSPVAVHCLLHEVVPAGGKDEVADDAAIGFERPPEGALRLEPLSVRRIRSVHPWIVPVRGARIDAFDDLTRALWRSGGRPVPFHVLGDAAFEPDRGGFVQTERITVGLGKRNAVNELQAGSAQSRRIAVLQPFPDPGEGEDGAPTYRWDKRIRAGSVQVLDAATTQLALTDGCIIVLSTEGVARAFELEIGDQILDPLDIERYRAPQLEDYSELAG